MSQQRRTLTEIQTSLDPVAVLSAAKEFFTRRTSIYAAYVEQEGPGFVTLRGLGGEEIAIAAQAQEQATRVTGSSYMFDSQISRFFSTLPPAVVAGTAGTST